MIKNDFYFRKDYYPPEMPQKLCFDVFLHKLMILGIQLEIGSHFIGSKTTLAARLQFEKMHKTTGCSVETVKKYLLIARARKQPISWNRCPSLHYSRYVHFDILFPKKSCLISNNLCTDPNKKLFVGILLSFEFKF